MGVYFLTYRFITISGLLNRVTLNTPDIGTCWVVNTRSCNYYISVSTKILYFQALGNNEKNNSQASKSFFLIGISFPIINRLTLSGDASPSTSNHIQPHSLLICILIFIFTPLQNTYTLTFFVVFETDLDLFQRS